MAFYLYILECNDKSFYIGHTDNIEKRICEHNEKKHAGYTSSKLPVKLVSVHLFGTRDEALAAEQQVKKWSRKKKEALIREDWDLLSKFALKKFKE